MKLKLVLFTWFLACYLCLDFVAKGSNHIMTRINDEGILIISQPFCYRYTISHQFTILKSNMPPISKGASLLKIPGDEFILVTGTPFFLLHLDSQCNTIQRFDTLNNTEPNHKLRLTQLSSGDVMTLWVYQLTLYIAKYTPDTKNFSVQSYSFSGDSNDVICEEISPNKLLCVYYINNVCTFGLYDINSSLLLTEETTNAIKISQVLTPGNLLRIGDQNIIYCLESRGSEVICLNIKEVTNSIEIKNSIIINDYFDWMTNSHGLNLWKLSSNEFLLFSREGNKIKTQRGFSDLTLIGGVCTFDFSGKIDNNADYSQEILFEMQPIDNTLLAIHEVRNDVLLVVSTIPFSLIDKQLFIGLNPLGGEVNLGTYLYKSQIIFFELPSKGRFYDLNRNKVTLGISYQVEEIVFEYDAIIDKDNLVNEWNNIFGTVASQNSTLNIGIFSGRRPLAFAYCYHSCNTCLEWGSNQNHYCRDCSSGYYKMVSRNQCYNEDTRPENSFWDNDLNQYDFCFGLCRTCSHRKEGDNCWCDSCKDNFILQPKGNKNCVQLCIAPIRWYIDLDGNYFCTPTTDCPAEYSYYNPNTNECVLTCSLINQVYYNYACYPTCPGNTYEYNGECYCECPGKLATDEHSKKCINCRLISKLNYKGTCIDPLSRPDNTYIANEEFKILLDCFELDSVTEIIKTYYGIETECQISCPEYYYYIPNDSTCNKCYSSCKTCSQRGTPDKNNCIECLDNFLAHPLKKGMCLQSCPHYWYIQSETNDLICTDNCKKLDLYLNLEKKECLEDCPISTVIYDDQCLKECPDRNMIIYNYQCFPPDTPKIEMEKDWKDILDNLNDSLKNYYDNLTDISPSIIENDDFTIQVCDPKNETASKEAIENNLSIINLGECENILRDFYCLPSDKPLLILKIDVKDNKTSITPTVRYKVFDYEGNELDISVCDGVKIEIDYPIINDSNIDLDQAEEFSKAGIDVYAKGDPFFNDICYPYSTSNDKDIPIDDRRNNIHQNASLCQPGCTYTGIEFDTKRVSCSCNTSINEIDEDEQFKQELLGEVFQLFDSSTIMVVKCYKLVFNLEIIIHNVGFWLFVGFTLGLVIALILFSILGYVKLYAYLNQFPKKTLSDLNTERENKIKTLSAPPYKTRTGHQNNNTVVVSPSYESGEYCISKDDKNKNGYRGRQGQMESNEFLCTPKKNQNIDSVLTLHNNLCNNKTIGIIPTSLNTAVGSKKNLIIRSSLSKVSTAIIQSPPDEDCNKKTLSNKTHKKTLTVTPLKFEEEKPIEYKETDLDYDSLEIEEAMIKDKRGLCKIYWDSIKSDQMIISLFANKSIYSPFLIRLILFIFTMSLFFSMNALFFNEDQISSRYHSTSKLDLLYIIKNEISKCLYASLITSLVSSVSTYLVSNYQLRKIIKEENDPDKYILGIKKNLSCFKFKIYFFLIFSMLAVLFCWYYVAAFCAVYGNNQISWIEGSLITFTLSNLLGFVLLFVSSLLRFSGNRMKLWCLFKISLYVKEFAT